MKKYKIFIVIFIALMGVGFSIYEYSNTFKTELANAANTKPVNGHSWSEMESDSDSIQVSGRTITNLVAPVNSTDATNKDYVDAASSLGTYNTCYLINSPNSGLSCATGYTTLVRTSPTTAGWVFDSSVASDPRGAFFVTLGGGIIHVTTYAVDGSVSKYSADSNTWSNAYSCSSGPGYMQLIINGREYNSSSVWGVSSVCPHSFMFCCK